MPGGRLHGWANLPVQTCGYPADSEQLCCELSGGHAGGSGGPGRSGTENGMITSLSNSRVKNVTALNRKAKERKSQGKYVVEGIKMFLEAPEDVYKRQVWSM